MARNLDLTQVVESNFITEPGVYEVVITRIENKVSAKGTEYDAVYFETPNGDMGNFNVFYPNDPTAKNYRQRMGFLKSDFRKMGLDVDGGMVNIEDSIGQMVTVKGELNKYEVTDEFGAGTGEFKKNVNFRLK